MNRLLAAISLVVTAGAIFGCDSNKQESGLTPARVQEEKTKTTGEVAGNRIESFLLKQELIQAVAEQLQIKQPNADPKELKAQAAEMVNGAMAKNRKTDPGFLLVSPATENRLKSNAPISDAAQRIEHSLDILGATLSILAKALLLEHQAGTLSPRRTELLAHLLTLDARNYEKALRGK